MAVSWYTSTFPLFIIRDTATSTTRPAGGYASRTGVHSFVKTLPITTASPPSSALRNRRNVRNGAQNAPLSHTMRTAI